MKVRCAGSRRGARVPFEHCQVLLEEPKSSDEWAGDSSRSVPSFHRMRLGSAPACDPHQGNSSLKKILLFHWPQFKGLFAITTLSPLLKYKPFKCVYIAVAGEPLSEQWLVLWSHRAKNSILPRRMNTFLILLHPPLEWTGFYHGKVVLRMCHNRTVCVIDKHSLCDIMWPFIWLFICFISTSMSYHNAAV